jgi:SAM-dependent methyltransferase
MEVKKEEQLGEYCPICDEPVATKYVVKEQNLKIPWKYCGCGTCYSAPVDKSFFTPEYQSEFKKQKAIQRSMEYSVKVYAPLIEEMIYGRKFLDIGFCADYRIQAMKARGWVSTGIDLIDNDYIKGDFETFDFGNLTFDLLWMGNVLECFDNPLNALLKAWDLLRPRGILYLSAADTEQIFYLGHQSWGKWHSKEHYIYFAERKLKDELKRMGFDIVLSWKVFSRRFPSWNDTHIIAQKR